MPKLIHMITDQPEGTRFFQQDQLVFLTENGWDVTVISSPGSWLDSLTHETNIAVIPVKMARNVSPLWDVFALVRIAAAIYRIKPDLVSAGTPKAGLLGMVAAKLLRVPARVYFLRGLRLETERGALRALLNATEKLASYCANRIVCVSRSLRDRYLELNLTTAAKVCLLGNGSSNGIDPSLYEPTEQRRLAGLEIRRTYNIEPTDVVIGYVGRLAKDKGGKDLLMAFELVKEKIANAHLLIVGDCDKSSTLSFKERALLAEDPAIHVTGFLRDVSWHYHAIDILAFPSHREGFPRVPLEAAASQIPIVAYSATGTVDAVRHNHTGLLSPVGSYQLLADNLLAYATDSGRRRKHGLNAQKRAIEEFHYKLVWDRLLELYRDLVAGESRGHAQ